MLGKELAGAKRRESIGNPKDRTCSHQPVNNLNPYHPHRRIHPASLMQPCKEWSKDCPEHPRTSRRGFHPPSFNAALQTYCWRDCPEHPHTSRRGVHPPSYAALQYDCHRDDNSLENIHLSFLTQNNLVGMRHAATCSH